MATEKKNDRAKRVVIVSSTLRRGVVTMADVDTEDSDAS